LELNAGFVSTYEKKIGVLKEKTYPANRFLVLGPPWVKGSINTILKKMGFKEILICFSKSCIKSWANALVNLNLGERYGSMCFAECRLYLSEYGELEAGHVPDRKRQGAGFEAV
jgi:hypothetical protein